MSISPPETRDSLLRRLQDGGNIAAWDEFAAIYVPVVYRSARRVGLQSADADDLVQEVLSAVARSLTRWLAREDRGTFRAWLLRIARNTAIDFLTRRKHRPWAAGGSDDDELHNLPAAADVSCLLDMEYRRQLFLRASEIIRQQVSETTWQAFFRTSVQQHGIQTVANQLDISRGSVYIARSRVMKRLQHVVKTLQDPSHDTM